MHQTAHAADVERDARLHARERAGHVVGDRDFGARLDLEVGEALAAARAAPALDDLRARDSEPYASAVHTESNPSRSASSTLSRGSFSSAPA